MSIEKMIEEYLAIGGEIELCPPSDRVDHIVKVLSGAKARAKKRGLAYNLDRKWYLKRFEGGRCEATGIKFYPYVGKSSRHPHSPSIDRINSSKGYTKDNCWLVCWAFNTAKADFSLKDFVEIAELVVKNKKDILKRGEGG
jgi:hypothetical protein